MSIFFFKLSADGPEPLGVGISAGTVTAKLLVGVLWIVDYM